MLRLTDDLHVSGVDENRLVADTLALSVLWRVGVAMYIINGARDDVVCYCSLVAVKITILDRGNVHGEMYASFCEPPLIQSLSATGIPAECCCVVIASTMHSLWANGWLLSLMINQGR